MGKRSNDSLEKLILGILVVIIFVACFYIFTQPDQVSNGIYTGGSNSLAWDWWKKWISWNDPNHQLPNYSDRSKYPWYRFQRIGNQEHFTGCGCG